MKKNKIEDYPDTEYLLILSSPSEQFMEMNHKMQVFGYNSVAAYKNEDFDSLDLLSPPKVALVELQKDTPNEGLQNKIEILRLEYPGIKIIAVYSKVLDYPAGDLKKIGVDCIYRLNFEEGLIIDEVFETAPVQLEVHDLNLDALARVNIIELQDQPLPFDIFVFLPSNRKAILYRPKGEDLEKKTIEKFKKFTNFNIYIRKSDLKKYKKHCAFILLDIQNDENLPPQIKNKKIASKVKELMGNFFSENNFGSESAQATLNSVGKVLEELVELNCKDKGLLESVKSLAGENMTSYTHSRNVATYCSLFGMSLGIGTPEELHMGGLLHDIGLSDFSPDLMWKAEEDMNESELAQYKLHPGNARLEISERKLNVSDNVLNMILQHHENPDGSGFPYGLTADKIDPLAKICSFADEFDRLTSVREGEKMYTPSSAIDRISGEDGDPPLAFYEEKFHSEIVSNFKSPDILTPNVAEKNSSKLSTPVNTPASKNSISDSPAPLSPETPQAQRSSNISPKSNGKVGVVADSQATPSKATVPDAKISEKPQAEAVLSEENDDLLSELSGLIDDDDGSIDHLDPSDQQLTGDNTETAVHEAKDTTSAESIEKSSTTTLDEKIEKESQEDSSPTLEAETIIDLDEKVADVDDEGEGESHSSICEELLEASKNGEIEEIEASLAKGADPDSPDANGNTPLMHAVNRKRQDLAEALLEQGADVDAVNKAGKSAIDFAKATENVDLMGSLESFRHAKKPSKSKLSASHSQNEKIKPGKARPQANSVDINKRNKKGQTLFMQVCLTGDLGTVEKILAMGANLNAKDFRGHTSLILAAQKGYTAIVEFLLQEGASINNNDGSGKSALQHAIETRNSDTVKVLLENGARADQRFKGVSLLMLASFIGHLDSVKHLLDAGARSQERDFKGKTASDYAEGQNHLEVIELLESYDKEQAS